MYTGTGSTARTAQRHSRRRLTRRGLFRQPRQTSRRVCQLGVPVAHPMQVHRRRHTGKPLHDPVRDGLPAVRAWLIRQAAVTKPGNLRSDIGVDVIEHRQTINRRFPVSSQADQDRARHFHAITGLRNDRHAGNALVSIVLQDVAAPVPDETFILVIFVARLEKRQIQRPPTFRLCQFSSVQKSSVRSGLYFAPLLFITLPERFRKPCNWFS
jgi:hypothetical protein